MQSTNLVKKIERRFEFEYPLKHKVIVDLRIVIKHEGYLTVQGVGYFDPSVSPLEPYDRYAVDIDAVLWNGTNIKTVIEVMGNIDAIEEEAVRCFAAAIDKESKVATLETVSSTKTIVAA